MPAAPESVSRSYLGKQSRNFTTPRRRLHVGVGVLRRSGWRLNAEMAEGPPGNLCEPSSSVHPASRQRTDAGSHHPGLGQMDVNGLILLGHKMLVAVREALGRLSRGPTLGVVFHR
jgi:hypothetical protein